MMIFLPSPFIVRKKESQSTSWLGNILDFSILEGGGKELESTEKNWKIEECAESLTKSHVWLRYNGNVIMVVFIKILCSLKWCRAQVKTIHIILYDHESAVISNLDVINICNTWLYHSPLLPPHPPANNFIVFWFYLQTTGFTTG